jgi:S-adenosylmethionine synthetase
LSRLEQQVLAIDRSIAERRAGGSRPARGEDVKIMGVRHANDV